MPVTRFIQNALNAGELSPRVAVRGDWDRYKSGVETMRNWTLLPHGGAKTRPGTFFVAQTKDAAKAYLIPFEVSTIQPYMIEAGDLYFRFYKNGARINDLTGTIAGAANNGSGLIRITNVAHGLSTGNYVKIDGVLGTTEANGEWVVTVINADTFDLQSSTFTNAYTSGGTWGRPFVLVTPYLIADISTLKWAQSADTLYLAHGTYAPRKLTRTSDTSWTLATISFLDGPYMDQNLTTTTLRVSLNTVGTGRTMTASAALFNANHVNSLWRIKGSTVWGYVKVTGFTSSTVVTVEVILALDFPTPDVSTTTAWREGSWSTHRGFPQCNTIFEQRLFWGATATEAQTLWSSTTGSYEDMTPSAVGGSVAASDAITYRLGSNKVNVIRWLLGVKDLIIGTVGEEFTMNGGTTALQASNPPIVRSGTTYGSSTVQAVRIGNRVFFNQRAGHKLRSSAFDVVEDTYKAPDVSLPSEHLLRSTTISRMAYQLEPDSILWVVRSDGKALSFTVHDVEQVYGWAQHGTDGTYVDVGVIPNTAGTGDNLWQIVSRTIGGSTKHYVEYADPILNVDSALSYDGTNAFTLTPGATTGTGVTFTASGSVFVAGDVGKVLILLGYEVSGVKWYSRATIKTFVSGTQVTADIDAAFPNTSAVTAGSWGIGKTTLDGLYHLNGRTVSIVGDQAVYDTQTVSGGSVTLKYGDTVGPAAVKIQAGLAFSPTPKIVTLQPAVSDASGTSRNKWKHWATVECALEETMGLTINSNPLQYRKPSDPMDSGPPVFTGDKSIPHLLTSKTGQLTFEQTLPLSATLLAYWGELEIGD
jgi:hypothetical protein